MLNMLANMIEDVQGQNGDYDFSFNPDNSHYIMAGKFIALVYSTSLISLVILMLATLIIKKIIVSIRIIIIWIITIIAFIASIMHFIAFYQAEAIGFSTEIRGLRYWGTIWIIALMIRILCML